MTRRASPRTPWCSPWPICCTQVSRGMKRCGGGGQRRLISVICKARTHRSSRTSTMLGDLTWIGLPIAQMAHRRASASKAQPDSAPRPARPLGPSGRARSLHRRPDRGPLPTSHSAIFARRFKFGADRPVADIVVFDTARWTKSETLKRDGHIPLRNDALQTQGIDSLTSTTDSWRNERGETLVAWMEQML